MIDPARAAEIQYQIAHRHKDGSWAEMEEIAGSHGSGHHDPSAHDPERKWGLRRIFRCRTCDETATIEPGSGDE